MTDPLGRILRAAEKDIQLVNAYIIPNQDFIDGIGRIVARGVEVRILTNSLASHDVSAVNSHYRKWRKPMIETGAELYEFRADPAIKSRVDTAPENAWRVMLDGQGRLIWVNSDETVTRQPARNAWQRVMDWLFRILPESQL